jgi:hypothetical protein
MFQKRWRRSMSPRSAPCNQAPLARRLSKDGKVLIKAIDTGAGGARLRSRAYRQERPDNGPLFQDFPYLEEIPVEQAPSAIDSGAGKQRGAHRGCYPVVSC